MSRSVDILLNAKDNVSGPARHAEGALSRFGSVLAHGAGLAAGAIGFQAITHFIGESLHKFLAMEVVTTRVSRALELNGEVAKDVMPGLREYAAHLAHITVASRGTVMALLDQGIRMGQTSEQAKVAAKAALGLAEITGIDQTAAMESVNQAMHGQFRMLGRLIPAIKNAGSESEKMAILQNMAAKGFDLAQERAGTTAGMIEHFHHVTEMAGKIVGQVFGPGLAALATGLEDVLPAIEEWIDDIRSGAAAIYEQMLPALHAFGVGAITVFTMAQVVSKHWSASWDVAIQTVALAITIWREEFIHTITVRLPAYFKWFGENWVNLIRDAFMLSVTIVSNALTKIGDMAVLTWKFVTSGFSGGFGNFAKDLGKIATEGWLEGFEAATKDLPAVAARKITKEELGLADSIASSAAPIADEFNAKLEDRLGAFNAKLAGERIKREVEKIELPQIEHGKEKKEKKEKEQQSLKVEESRFLRFGPGAMEPQLKTAENTRESVITLKDCAATLRKLLDKAGAPNAIQLEAG